MPACHAGGHEFESRTHRRKAFKIILEGFFCCMPGMYCLYVYLPFFRKLSIKMRKMSLNDVFYWLIVCIQSRFSCQQWEENIDVARRFAFADGSHYAKLMTEKSEKKMLFCKICLQCSLHRKFLFLNNAYLYIMPCRCGVVYLYKSKHG